MSCMLNPFARPTASRFSACILASASLWQSPSLNIQGLILQPSKSFLCEVTLEAKKDKSSHILFAVW